jgi:Domain of unknown function (DUF4266)
MKNAQRWKTKLSLPCQSKELLMKNVKVFLYAGVVGAILASTGCASTGDLGQVSPWEKGNLAKSKMTFEGDPLDQRFVQHIYGSKENSSGGYGVGGGGCGCN